jgi:acyl carrier protein
VAPGTSTEIALAKIWGEVLGLKQVGLHDNFFDLGGHSLLLLRVQARLGEVLDAKVSIAEMFQYPTISSLAMHISRPTVGSGRLHKVRERVRLQKEALGRQRQMKGV